MAAMKTLKITLVSLFLLTLWAPLSVAQDHPPVLEGLDFENPAKTTWTLPKELKDISGLAMTPDGRLFATEEKRAIIHEINFIEGTIVKTFSFGRPPAKKDFEALAIAGKRFFLISEKGLLLEGREGFNGEGKVFNQHDTGFGKFCKTEGLASSEGKLFALCGKAEDKAYKGFLTILSWDIATKKADDGAFLQVPWGGENFPTDLGDFSPSGLEILANGNFLILSSDKKMLVELSASGEIIGHKFLNKKTHDGPVGLAISANGKLIIADQGGTPTIQVYEK